MRVCLTDATFKHTLAIARYLKSYDRSLRLIGISPGPLRCPRVFARHFDEFYMGSFEETLCRAEPDMVIPVGHASVESLSAMSYPKAILPSADSVALALSKPRTLALASRLGVPVPRTLSCQSFEELRESELVYPCVVKGSLEAGKNVVGYAHRWEEMVTLVRRFLKDPSQKGIWPVVQEYVSGVGLGFFAFYQKGRLKRFYMHQRVREFPVTGGASTAAKTLFHAQGFEYGRRLLDALEWNGVAMVEFKHQPETDRLTLMEINPKFWGSTELGLCAGVNFGEILVRAYSGESISENLSPESYQKISFAWPLDGDLKAMAAARRWSGLRDYIRGRVYTNLRTNGFVLNSYLFMRMIRDALRR